MAGERRGHVLQTSALVSEAYVRLWTRPGSIGGTARTSSPCARLMRQVLIQHARARQTDNGAVTP